jgi:hypothetical protein
LILEEVKPQTEQHGDRELTIQEWEKEQQQERALAILEVLSSITSSTESESTATLFSISFIYYKINGNRSSIWQLCVRYSGNAMARQPYPDIIC